MNMSTPAESIGAHLLKHNIKPSYQRVRIMDYLMSVKSHPTVDEIYTELVKDIPTLSKTTVYNTLNLFTGAGVARVITIEDNETRYDADMSFHGHFKCNECGKIYDFRIDGADLKTDDLDGFAIQEKNVYYKGICKQCLENKKNNP